MAQLHSIVDQTTEHDIPYLFTASRLTAWHTTHGRTYTTFEQCVATLALQSEKMLDEKAEDMTRMFAKMEADSAAVRGRAQVLATQLHKEAVSGVGYVLVCAGVA